MQSDGYGDFVTNAGEGQLRRDEIRAGVASLSRRLDRHLSAWEAGDQDAMFDVAAVARTLLANGNGDKALLRLCSQEKLDPPRITVRYPTPPQDEVAFAFGGFPSTCPCSPLVLIGLARLIPDTAAPPRSRIPAAGVQTFPCRCSNGFRHGSSPFH